MLAVVLEWLEQRSGPLDLSATLPIEVPNVGRADLARLFAALDYRTGAEIGVKEGVYSAALLDANPRLHLYAIDSWALAPDNPHIGGQALMDRYYETARTRLSPDRCHLMRMLSAEAVTTFTPGSLDFVYIDGAHDAANVMHDLTAWSQIVRPGGIVSGHDYVSYRRNRYPRHGVQLPYAVKESLATYTAAQGIAPWFVLGAGGMPPGIVRDKPRSWMWVNG